MNQIKSAWSKQSLACKLIILLGLSLPFDLIPTLEVFGYTLKLSSLLGVCLMLLTAYKLIKGEIKVEFKVLHWLLLSWIGLLMINLIRAGFSNDALHFAAPILFLSVLAFCISLVATNLDKQLLYKAIIFGAFLAAIFGIYQVVGNYLGLGHSLTGLRDEYTWQKFGFPRLQSVALEPLYFSAFLLLPIGLIYSALILDPKSRTKTNVALLCLFLICDGLTLSRGGLVALVFMLVVLTVILVSKEFLVQNWKKIAVLAGAIFASLIIGLAALGLAGRQGIDSDLTYGKKGLSQVLAHLTNTRVTANEMSKTNDDSVNQRQNARNQALDSLNDSVDIMLIGSGVGEYDDYLQSKYTSGTYYEHPGNVVLEVAVQMGLIALGVLVAFFVMLLIKLWGFHKSKNIWLAIFASATFAYILAVGLQSNFFSGLAITHVWFMIGISLALTQERTKNGRNSSNQKAVRTA